MFGCQHGRAPQCLIDCCLPVSDVASRQHLLSASRRLLVVPYRITVSARTAAGLLPSLARRPGTLSQIISGIWTLLQTTSSTCWKRFYSQRISAISALDVSRRCALQIYILLTCCCIFFCAFTRLGDRKGVASGVEGFSDHCRNF